MITKDNYFSIVNLWGVERLPATLQKSHDFVSKITEGSVHWKVYESNENIRKVIDLYFTKLEEYFFSQDGGGEFLKTKTNGHSHSHKEGATKAVSNDRASAKKSSSKGKTSITKNSNKAVKKSNQTEEDDNEANPELVEHISEEVKFIRRYIRLHNKIKSSESLLSLIKSLQRAILHKLISKSSEFATEIRTIQDKLVEAYNNSKGKDLKIQINDNDLPKLVAIAGGEEVYPSINIMKRYVGMQGKKADGQKLNLFLRHIENVLEKKRVAGDDPYYEKVKAIFNTLKKLKSGSTVHMATAELNGLDGIVKACSCKTELGRIFKTGKPLRQCRKGTYTDSKKNGACSHNNGLTGLPSNGVLTAEQMANRKLDLLNFHSVWFSLFGKPAKNFTLMIHGEPHNGKTIVLLLLAKFLADNFGNVLYVSSEEFSSPSMTKKVNEFLNPFPQRLHFAENLDDPNLSNYEFIILDSINDLGLRLNDYKELREAHPGAAFIFILQHTKSGEFRGGKEWEHKSEIVAEVSKGIITVTKNRYAPKTTLDFFKHRGIEWKEPQAVAA